jgi:hypothetical protein
MLKGNYVASYFWGHIKNEADASDITFTASFLNQSGCISCILNSFQISAEALEAVKAFEDSSIGY